MTTNATRLPPDQAVRLQSCADLMRQRRFGEAVAQLRSLVRDVPRLADAHQMLGVAYESLGDMMAAEESYRAALDVDPSLIRSRVGLAEALRNLDRGVEAIALLEPLVTPSTSDLSLLTYYAFALQSVGRWDEAVAWLQQAARTSPSSAVAEHNVASAFADLMQHEESEAAARRAFARGLDAPETWLVLARALDQQSRPEEAEAAYREALSRRPDYAEALGDLAKREWARTGRPEDAEAILDAAIARNRNDPGLRAQKAQIREAAGDAAGAIEALEAALLIGPDPLVHASIAQSAARIDPPKALEHAQRAFALRPDNYFVLASLCQARLANGRPAEAAALAEILTERQPWDQYALALLATCWRMLDDPRFRELYDYDLFVRSYRLEAPDGWTSLETFLADVAAELAPMHRGVGHPVGQSVRQGTQTGSDLKTATTPALQAALRALDAPIRAYMREVGEGTDPLRRRLTGDYRLDGVWSVRLRPGGFHTDHVHHRGWISSACYIEVPATVEADRQGWLKFGEPGLRTEPALPPERYEKPEPGKLVLFPAYMWHGTMPFSGDQRRLSIAFDVMPR